MTGAVLAGGRSSRMGVDKAGLTFDGKALLMRVLERLQLAGLDDLLMISGRSLPWLDSSIRQVPDSFVGSGPLGGLHAALTHASGDFCLVVACDMPLIEPDLLRLLLNSAQTEPYPDVVLPRTEQGIEPLLAVYRKSCLPLLAGQLRDHHLSMRGFCSKLQARYIDERQLRLVDPTLRSLVNINTPECWARFTAGERGSV